MKLCDEEATSTLASWSHYADNREWYSTSCDTWHWMFQTALLTGNRLRKLQEWNIGYTHHPTDVAMEWEQTMLQRQPPANKAARSTKIHTVCDVLMYGKLWYPAILWYQWCQVS